MLDEAQDDLARLREEREDRSSVRGDESSVSNARGGGARREMEKLERKVGDLEQVRTPSFTRAGRKLTPQGAQDNTSLRSQITAQVTMLSARNAEKDSLKDQIDSLRQDIQQLEEEVDQHEKARARSERSRSSEGEEKTREQLEEVRFFFVGREGRELMRSIAGERRVPRSRVGACASAGGSRGSAR